MVVVMLGACVADEPAPGPAPHVAVPVSLDVETLQDDRPVDLCALAAALPADDICSLTCDPDAFAARAVSDGAAGGRCYNFRCTLSADVTVSVGICL